MKLKFATTNAPESMKRGLIRDRLARARRVAGFYIRHDIDVGAAQEAGTYLEDVDNVRPEIKALWAAANDIVRGRLVGNGVVVKRRRWRAHLLEDITIGDGDDAVHIAVVLLTHRWTGFQFKFYAVHKPRRRGAENTYLRPIIDQQLRAHTRRDDVAGMPWVVAGDFNGSTDLGVDLGSHGPDHIRGSREFEPVSHYVVRRPLLSDHPFLVAVTEV